jgi:hypothetical protein
VSDLPRTAGRLVGAPLGALARWRGGKPMHPRGAVFDAVLDRHGGPDWGVPWLAATARDAAIARLSRGAGLPAPLPDLLGLAIRLTGGEAVDLLLTTTGRGALTRLVPVFRRDTATFYSSIMGYRSDVGTIRFAAVAQAHDVPSDPQPLARDVDRADLWFTVLAARGLGRWQPFGCLTLTRPVPSLDPDVRFDTVQHPPPGLFADGPMARFRAPAYARARAGRAGRDAATRER